MPRPTIPGCRFVVEIGDWQARRGRRYTFPAILALTCAAIPCGARRYDAIAEWARNYGQAQGGHIPQVMAALRNTTVALLRFAEETNIAAACRRFAAQPQAALALIGIALENCMTLGIVALVLVCSAGLGYDFGMFLRSRQWLT